MTAFTTAMLVSSLMFGAWFAIWAWEDRHQVKR